MSSFQLLVFDARRGNNEGEEAEKILGFYPDVTPERERISLAGLLQGLHMFRSSWAPPEAGEPFEISETDSSIWVAYEAEPGVFLALVASKSWLPRHVTQDSLLALLMHTHYLMRVLFCGVQFMLDKDQTATLARSSISRVLQNVGEELGSSASWINRELRNPLTTMGRAATISVSLPVTLDVHALCHRALNAAYDGASLVEDCGLFFNRCLLWSTLSGADAAALSALTRSTLFPGPFVGPSADLLGLTGLGASRHLRQLESGFFVLRDGGTLIEPSEFALPLIYSSSTLKYLLAYAQGELLLLMLTSRPSVSLDALTAVQQSVAPLTLELLPKLAEECQAHGGELGHLAGWRYNQESKLSARASPRTKISAMSHHARAVATAVSDSLSRLRDSSSDGNVEVCARSSQGVWVVADMEGGREQRQVVVVREKKVDADPSRAIASIDASLQSLSLV